MPDGIEDVVPLRAISEVASGVIGGISVQVANFLTGRSFADESLRHKLMHVLGRSYVLSTQGHLKVS